MLLTSSLLGRDTQARFRSRVTPSHAKLAWDRIGFWKGFLAFFSIFPKFSPFYLPRQGCFTRKKTWFTARLSCRREAHFFFILVISLGKGCEGFGEAWGSWGILWDTLGCFGEALCSKHHSERGQCQKDIVFLMFFEVRHRKTQGLRKVHIRKPCVFGRFDFAKCSKRHSEGPPKKSVVGSLRS